MGEDLDAVKAAKAALCLKIIITGLNDLSRNPEKEHIQEAYHSLAALAQTADEFAEIVYVALQSIGQDDITRFVSAGIDEHSAKCRRVFNDEDARDVILDKSAYTFKSVEINKQNKNIFSDFDAHPLQENEIVYVCYEEEQGNSKVNYKMKSPAGEEKRYTFKPDKNLDVCADIFTKITKEGHNESLVSDFKVQSAQRCAQLELIFGLAAEVKVDNANSNSYSFFAKQTKSSPLKRRSSSCLVM